jgi:acyl-CoA synthetase (AMP-forming)/AMP-acid ligase II
MADVRAALTQSYCPADTSRPILELTAGTLLRQAAAEAPDRVALVEAAPPSAPSLSGATSVNREWTYAALLAEAEACAHWLLSRFQPG